MAFVAKRGRDVSSHYYPEFRTEKYNEQQPKRALVLGVQMTCSITAT